VAHDEHEVAGVLGQRLEAALARLDHTLAKQQIPGRIAHQAHLRPHHQVRVVAASLVDGPGQQPRVAGNVTHRRVELGDRHPHHL
jgi:hypothetical protein